MHVVSQAGGLREYSVAIPVGIIKKDLQQIIEDGIQVRNRNFVQSTELVK